MKQPPIWKRLNLPKPRATAKLPKPGAKTRKAPVQHEESYQIQVAEFLRWALPPSVVFYAVPNGGWRTKSVAAKLKAGGVKPGVHDLHFLYRGVHHELELKIKPNGLSLEQKQHAEAVVAAGGKAGVASDTLEAVCAMLDYWGIPHARLGPQVKRAAPLSKGDP